MANFKYCPKCGMISRMLRKTSEKHPCSSCGLTYGFEVNPKWDITDEKWSELYKPVRYGEITEEEFDKQWEEHCKPFFEEVIKKRPEFDQEAYEHLVVWEEERERSFKKFNEQQKKIAERFPKLESQISSSIITCPYCKSTNTKKLSAASRGLSFGLFGFGSKKIGKQWHCNGCGSDF